MSSNKTRSARAFIVAWRLTQTEEISRSILYIAAVSIVVARVSLQEVVGIIVWTMCGRMWQQKYSSARVSVLELLLMLIFMQRVEFFSLQSIAQFFFYHRFLLFCLLLQHTTLVSILSIDFANRIIHY